jgi:hypothetical protein
MPEVVYAAIRSSVVACARRSTKSGYEKLVRPKSTYRPNTRTSRSCPSYGSGRSRTPFTTEKIALFAPIPTASVPTTANVKLGRRVNARAA